MSRLPISQVVLRLVLLLAPVVALLAVPGATSLWWLGAALLLGVLACRRPDSLTGSAVLALVGWRWVAVPGHGLPTAVLISMVALVAFEVACVLAALGPANLRLRPAVLRLWALRALVLVVPACLVFAAGRVFLVDGVLDDADASMTPWVVGVLAGASALVVLRKPLGLNRDATEG